MFGRNQGNQFMKLGQVESFAGPVVVEESDDHRAEIKGVGRQAEDPGADDQNVHEPVGKFGGADSRNPPS